MITLITEQELVTVYQAATVELPDADARDLRVINLESFRFVVENLMNKAYAAGQLEGMEHVGKAVTSVLSPLMNATADL